MSFWQRLRCTKRDFYTHTHTPKKIDQKYKIYFLGVKLLAQFFPNLQHTFSDFLNIVWTFSTFNTVTVFVIFLFSTVCETQFYYSFRSLFQDWNEFQNWVSLILISALRPEVNNFMIYSGHYRHRESLWETHSYVLKTARPNFMFHSSLIVKKVVLYRQRPNFMFHSGRYTDRDPLF